MAITREERLLKFIRECYNKSIACTKFLRFTKEYIQHFYSVALYSRVIMLTGSCLTLIEQKAITGLPVILRSLLEAYIDVINLIKDPGYSKNMDARNLVEWLRILNEAGTEKNPYLSKIAESDDLEKARSKWEKELEELKKEGRESLTAFDRFKMAGMEQEYRSVYNSLCSESHNDVRVLIRRHLEINEGQPRVVLYKDQSLAEITHYLDAMGLIIVNSSLQIHEFLRSEGLSVIKELGKEFQEIRNSWRST